MFLHKRYAVFFLVAVICYVPVTSQVVKKLNHIAYNVNEGLLHSQVIDLVEDGNGFIWISSGSGVQRFDGNFFYRSPLQMTIAVSPMISMYASSGCRMATYGSGIHRE